MSRTSMNRVPMDRFAMMTAVTALSMAFAVTQAEAQGDTSVAVTPGTFAVGDATVDVDLGRFSVPANRHTGSDARLTLRFVRFRSTAAAPGAPIVFLAGGPGDAATRAFRGMPGDFLAGLRAIADVIAFDQRGTGTSEPLNPVCPPAGVTYDAAAEPARMLDTLKARVGRCLDAATRRGIDVAGLTTAESADDLEALRQALGAARIMVLAGSYGTHLALTAARRHPELIDRMALAGVEGPDDTFKTPDRVDTVLHAIAAARRPSLPADIRTLRARLAAAPATVTLPNGGRIVVGAWDVQRWIADALDAVPEIDAVLAALPAMLDGDYTTLGRWAAGYRQPRALHLMNLAMDCASYASPERLDRIRRTAPDALLGDVINFPLPMLCDVAGLPRLPETFRAPLRSEVPALLVSGTFDGRTPVSNARDVAAGMPKARILVIDGASHGLFREAAVLDEIIAFLADPAR